MQQILEFEMTKFIGILSSLGYFYIFKSQKNNGTYNSRSVNRTLAINRPRKNGSCVKVNPRASDKYCTLMRLGNSSNLSRHL